MLKVLTDWKDLAGRKVVTVYQGRGFFGPLIIFTDAVAHVSIDHGYADDSPEIELSALEVSDPGDAATLARLGVLTAEELKVWEADYGVRMLQQTRMVDAIERRRYEELRARFEPKAF